MRCEKTQEFVSEYIEGTLERPMVVAVEAHLQQCGACAADVSALRQTWAALDAMPVVEPPADLAQRIAARVLPTPVARPARAWWEVALSGEWLRALTPVHAAGFAVAAGLVALGLLFPLRPSMPFNPWSIVPFHLGSGQPNHPPDPAPEVRRAPSVGFAVRTIRWENDGWIATVEVTPERSLEQCSFSMTPLSLVDDQVIGVARRIELGGGDLNAGQARAVPIRLGATQGLRAVLLRVAAPSLPREIHRTLYFPIPSDAPSPRTVSLELPESDVHVALARLAESARVSLVVDSDLGGRLPVQLQNASIEQALTAIAAPLGYRWARVPGGYAVMR